MKKPTIRDRAREHWHRIFAADPEGELAKRREYRRRNAKKLRRKAKARGRRPKWGRMIHRGSKVWTIQCAECGHGFKTKATRTNSYPRFCEPCLAKRIHKSKRAYDLRRAAAARKLNRPKGRPWKGDK